MHRIIEDWKYTLFTQPLSELLMLVAFIIAIRKRNQFPALKLIPFYLGAFVALAISKYILELVEIDMSSTRAPSLFETLPDFANCVIEFIAFSYFLYKSTMSPGRRQIIHFLGLCGPFIYLHRYAQVIVAKIPLSEYLLNSLYIVGSGILLIMAFLCLIDLYVDRSINDLTLSANFWLFCGLLFFLAGTMPYRLLSYYYFFREPDSYRRYHAVVHIFYIFLVVMVVRAYRCSSATGNESSKEVYNGQ